MSAYAPTPATSVGSLFGLKPYSAISFFRSSSAFFLAFLFLQKKNPIRKAAAITTIGMMTAMAILAPEPRPLEELELESEALNVEGVGLDEDLVVGLGMGLVEVGMSGANVDVTVTTDGVGVPASGAAGV